MSTVAVPASWCTDPTLTPTEFRLLACLVAKGSGPVVAERRVLSRWCGVSENTVGRAIANLEARGWLRVVRRPAEACTFTVLIEVAA